MTLVSQHFSITTEKNSLIVGQVIDESDPPQMLLIFCL